MNKAQIKKQYDLSNVDEEYFGPKYVQSAFEFKTWPVIPSDRSGQLILMKWGLIPHWVKSVEAAKKIQSKTVNARIETLDEKPSFRNSLNERRCLVLADGFYEFRELNGKKHPYFITLKDREIFSLAGLFDEWINPDSGELTQSFTVITTEANGLMEKIHNRKKRMPVILNPEEEKKWLSLDTNANDFIRPFPEEQMQAWTVSNRLTSRTLERNVPEVIDAFVYPEIQMADLMNI